MDIYENFMRTAKIIWEEFTGSNQNNKIITNENEKIITNIAPPIKRNISMGKYSMIILVMLM